MQNSKTLKITELAKNSLSSTFLIIPEKFIESLPVKIAVSNRNKSGYYRFTYGDIIELVVKLRQNIDAKLQGEERVGVFCKNPFLSILSILALWESGAAPVMLNCLLTDAEIRDEIELTKSLHVLMEPDLPFITSKNKLLLFDLLKSENVTSLGGSESTTNSEQKAVYIFTSGSTGMPKAVEHTVGSIIAAFEAGNKFLGFNPNDTWLLSLPLFHISGLSVLTRAMLSGAALIVSESGSVSDIIQAMSIHPVTICSLVPTQLKKLIDADITPPQLLRFSLIGGGKADVSLLQKGSHWQPCPVYGMSETGAFVTALKPEIVNLKKGSSGYLLDGVQINILNDEMESIVSSEIGEIGIKSKSLFSGYFNNAEEFSEKMLDGYFLTGDLGYIDEDGFLYITGRKVNVINSGGEKIQPHEIENLILSLKEIKECCVIGIPHPTWGEAVTAVISCQTGKSLTENDILRSLYKTLPSYKIPKRIIILPDLPKSVIGKINREKLYAVVESLSIYPENQK
jgi:O-succinylbenzoic acid--CoA ligase